MKERGIVSSWTLASVGLFTSLASGQTPEETRVKSAQQPNFLLITLEDLSPHFGCYGDPLARTPVVDRLAAEGFRYENAFALASVCAPCRSAILSARWTVSLGSQHMRSLITLPAGLRCFPAHLRDAGYFCYNAGKADYNFREPADAWNASGAKAKAGWTLRQKDQPFCGVYNFTETHQGAAMTAAVAARQRARLPPASVVDPSQVTVPPYYPDTPAVRQELANVYNNVALADIRVGELLANLEKDGLADNTIVIFFADGGDGIPRVKSHTYHESLHVPLVIRIPPKLRTPATPASGDVLDELVSLMDLGPTVLSLAGIKPPEDWDGRAFLGEHKAPAPAFLFAHRDRINSAYNFERAVMDSRWHYIRNFRPDLEPHAPSRGHEDDPVLGDARRLHREGKLTGPAAAWLERSGTAEHLYDVQNDPWCVTNLVADPAQRERLEQRRSALREWQVRVKDLGVLPESLQLRLAEAAGSPSAIAAEQLSPVFAFLAKPNVSAADCLKAIESPNATVRFWAVQGLGQAGAPAAHISALRKLLQDEDPTVRVAAANSLCRLGQTGEDAFAVLRATLMNGNYADRLEVINAVRCLGPAASSLRPELQRLVDVKLPGCGEQYLPTAAQYALQAIDGRGR